MGASPLTGSWIPEPQVARQQIDRILSSDLFRESPILQRLLRYLVEQALAGETTNLKEYKIGSTVFQRGDDFDPRTDSIVRVQVGVLRKKLAAYYEGPGGGDDIIIEVPRGHYAPHFQLRSVPVPTATSDERVRIAEPPLS